MLQGGLRPPVSPRVTFLLLPRWVFPWECFHLLAPRRKWHLTTPKLEMRELGFTWLPQNVGLHSSPEEMWCTQACIQWGR